MKKYTFIFLSLVLSSTVSASDWTPIFGDFLTPKTQQIFLRNQKPLKRIVKNIGSDSTDGRFGTVNLVNPKTPAYSNIPKPYRNDMQTTTIKRIDECHTTAITSLKNATLYGKSITHIVYQMDTCTHSIDNNYIVFTPMSEQALKTLEKQVVFKSFPTPGDVECTGQTSEPYAYLEKVGKEVRFSLNRNDQDC